VRDMSGPNKIDYSKLLGFEIVTDELEKGVDFKNPVVAAKLGAKAGATITVTKADQPMLMPEVSEPGVPVMQGLGGRKVPSS
jgi:hypothetical protein